jgi:hypothetical protein
MPCVEALGWRRGGIRSRFSLVGTGDGWMYISLFGLVPVPLSFIVDTYVHSHANTPCTVQEVPAVNPWTVHDKNDTATSEKSTAESLRFQEATSIETARKFPAIKPWVGGGFRRATSL